MTPMNIRKLQIERESMTLFKLNYNLDMDYWKGLKGSYDAATDLLIMFHNELTLTYENVGRPDFMLHEKCTCYKPTKIRK